MAKQVVATVLTSSKINFSSSFIPQSHIWPSFLAQQVEMSDFSNQELTQSSGSEMDERKQQFNNTIAYELFELLSTKAEISLLSKKSKK